MYIHTHIYMHMHIRMKVEVNIYTRIYIYICIEYRYCTDAGTYVNTRIYTHIHERKADVCLSFATEIAYAGWQTCIRCLNLYVSFRKRTTSSRSFVMKMTYKDTVSYGLSPPFRRRCPHNPQLSL